MPLSNYCDSNGNKWSEKGGVSEHFSRVKLIYSSQYAKIGSSEQHHPSRHVTQPVHCNIFILWTCQVLCSQAQTLSFYSKKIIILCSLIITPQKAFIIKDFTSKPEDTDFFFMPMWRGTGGPSVPAQTEAELRVIREYNLGQLFSCSPHTGWKRTDPARGWFVCVGGYFPFSGQEAALGWFACLTTSLKLYIHLLAGLKQKGAVSIKASFLTNQVESAQN